MHLSKIPLAKTNSFSDFFLDYIQQKEALKPFYNLFPSITAFKKQIEEKQDFFPQSLRDVLSSTLAHQYSSLQPVDTVITNIQLLKDTNTFTITTGHQLNIFTGPLYFIYKIVTVINTCKDLKKKYPNYNFVPVYWMASEDHDYDEIKSFRLNNKKYTWKTEQQGAVGRFSTKGIEEIINELPGDVTIFREAYLSNTSLSEATRHYVNKLFGHEGLIIIDADRIELKSQFKQIMEDDILHHSAKKCVDQTNTALENLGYKTQVFCRDINFFYLDDRLRSRIEKKDDHYHVIDTDISFTKESIIKAIDTAPEKFSPNVILRPLYQEMILPNLAYVGGPSEMIYWLQLKDVFEYYKTPFPILLPRNFVMIIEQHTLKKFNKTGLEWADLFKNKDQLFNEWIHKNSTHNLSTESEKKNFDSIYTALRQRAEALDKTLGMFVGAENKRAFKSLEKIEKKMVRAEKRIQEEKLGQIEAVKEALFPNGGLQERTENFLNFYQTDPEFIQNLLNLLDPFDFQFNILTSKT